MVGNQSHSRADVPQEAMEGDWSDQLTRQKLILVTAVAQYKLYFMIACIA